jgi:diguanylate cyclase (GGDEF)-like protein
MAPDELTGLSNRGEILIALQSALAQSSQHNQALALVYVDLDHLLTVNTDFGHVAGDEYLRLVSVALAEVFGPSGPVGRIGGDEFNAILTAQTLEQVRAKAESVRARVQSNPLEVIENGEKTLHPISVSVGIAYLPSGEAPVTTDELTRRAYEAVLRTKEKGGNAVQVYTATEERDALTGAVKRAGLLARLDAAFSAAERAHSTVAVLTIDIDEFDNINKQFGHYTGDEVLRRVAAILHGTFKEIGLVGRSGGDEFVVILPDSRSETAFILAEEVRKVIEDTPIPIQAGEMRSQLAVRISGGVAEYPSDGSDWREILRKADEALYRAKHLGRNRICLPVSSQMVTKTAHFTQTQLEKLAELGRRTGKSEAYLLREALDDVLRKYEK